MPGAVLISGRALLLGWVVAATLVACGDAPEGPRDAKAGEGDADVEVVDAKGAEDADAAADDAVAADGDHADAAPDEGDATSDEGGDLSGDDARDADAADLEDATPADVGPEDVVTPPGDVDACPPEHPCTVPFMAFCDEGRCSAQGVCVVQAKPGCCLQDADCAGQAPGGTCQAVRCVSNQCTSVPRPGCCLADEDCADDVACSTDTCSDAGRCVHCPADCACPAQPYPLALGFDAGGTLGQLGLFQVDYKAGDGVAWQIDTHRAARGAGALYLGNPACRTYYNGKLGPDCQPTPGATDSSQVRIDLYGPVLSLPVTSAGHVGLVWVWADVEPPSPAVPTADALQIFAQDLLTGFEWPLAATTAFGKSTWGAWRLLAFDLSPWRGATMRLRFAFDTLDGQDNHREGVYLDELTVVDRCQGGCCQVDADCVGTPLPDACSEARCVTLDDGAGRVCAAVPKTPGVACSPCVSDDDCADANPCTTDACAPDGRCLHQAFCCFEVDLLADGFESGLDAWFLEGGEGAAGWQSLGGDAWEGQLVAAFVNPQTGTYGPGASAGAVRSAVVGLPPAPTDEGQLELAFRLRLDTEWDGLLYDNPLGVDRLAVDVISGGLSDEVWSSDELMGTTAGQWTLVTVPLEAWAGQAVQVRFRFDTVDDAANDFAGPRLDDVRIRRGCP